MHVAGKAANSIEALVRARMRRQQFANSVLIFALAAVVILGAGYFIVRSVDWGHVEPAKEPKPVRPAPVRAKPVAPVAPAAPATVAIPVAVAPAPVTKPVTKPAEQSKPKPRLDADAPPRIAPAPSVPPPPPAAPEVSAPPTPSALERPSAAAAKRMLFSIKCFDSLAYEGSARGREYFSGLCKDGHRMEVSCAGAGCKVEYAPPPSHLR